ncbi:MAG: 2-dehydro-3-deoxy-D-gluconate 5-dehydrogenase KduD [candidate division KSB1 bacterium]|nr:2-dehydro-3-deoxy-D-gluconate 5-dehydrogenase KduD [candidate division KSB1 bacterium]MDZ7273540.1 2-dehydro-3-deoxy-D-gluconate 5-dehydrogenase KduD [candidate division KSB1 bacterium]MDZ7286869.1 2-dehydro-3-deoxy-D-gluconate 5-dehydrogenase KduD [candidate division KSB1 bacterium]MDZ7299778.1 2-dehydro-3-deoxy-D-gluconate 5-dehydrogenase KduD [candidate division KSB1 bacterium]MDZ7307661.1 2-dehydro-3-deoxy-D-gluconate 5-dehydrogenase KduD [candidate division KSB1 bacterium]
MILDKFKLNGKIAIVTGASRGLGRGMALGLAEAGADLVLAGVSDMSAVQREIEKLGRRCVTVIADLGNKDCVPTIVNSAVEKLGGIDILVNNAGIIRRAPVLEFAEKDWDEVIKVNLRTLFFLSQAVAKVMVGQKRGGKIINVASLLSFQGGILVPSYTAAKSGVMGLTRIFANELACHNINVNAIAPGYMATDNTKALREDPKRSTEILARIPAGRWGTPEDLMGAIVFLASEASNYMHGHTLVVDGGWLSR